jgi:hypothetical protein
MSWLNQRPATTKKRRVGTPGFASERRVGSILAIGLRNVPKGFNRVHLVHVVHVTAQSGGSFLVGGTLDPPLTYQELTGLVM